MLKRAIVLGGLTAPLVLVGATPTQPASRRPMDPPWATGLVAHIEAVSPPVPVTLPLPTTTTTTRPPPTTTTRPPATTTTRPPAAPAKGWSGPPAGCAGDDDKSPAQSHRCWDSLVHQWGDWSWSTMEAVLWCESRGDEWAHNPSGAEGLMQDMDGPQSPYQNMVVAHHKWKSSGTEPWNSSRSCWG